MINTWHPLHVMRQKITQNRIKQNKQHCCNNAAMAKQRTDYILKTGFKWIDRKLGSCSWAGRNTELDLCVSIYLCKIYFLS